VRQLLAESFVLALAGAALGLVLARWTTAAILQAIPFEHVSRALFAGLDLRILAFVGGLTILTTLLFGLTPALQATRLSLAPALKSDPAGMGALDKSRFRRALVTFQFALSVLLLAAAGVFSLTLFNLTNVDLGFQPRHLMSFGVDPVLLGRPQGRRSSLAAELLAEFKSLPGLDAVSFAVDGPLNSSSSMTVRIDGYEGPEQENLNVTTDWVGPEYFSSVGFAVLAGREFSGQDRPDAPPVAIINRSLAERYFPGRDPLGQRIVFAYQDPAQPMEIVGVVDDSKLREMREEGEPCLYVPYAQNSASAVRFFVRTRLPTASVAAMVREGFRASGLPVPRFEALPMETQINDNLYIERIIAAGSVSFGLIAALLAGIGLYGVVAYTVAQRTKEIGVRIALGATRKRLVWMVVKDIVRMAAFGTLGGVAGCLMLGRLVESQLYGVSATSPLIIAAAVGVIVLVALAAGAVPSRRAAGVDPTIALRNE
jgi:predicted permease